jgi:type IV pilus assembly protein PilO
MLSELRELDFNDVGSAPRSIRYLILILLLAAILAVGYYLLIKSKKEQLEVVQQKELTLRTDFEYKQQKAANLEAYEAQLAEMQKLLETMFRQLPSKTEMDKLLVDISQTALGAGIDVQLFQPNAETLHDFYAERPISVRMLGDYHQFGEFVSGVASLPRVVILTMHDIALRRATDTDVGISKKNDGRLILEGTVKTYRYIDDEEAAARAEVAKVAKP